MQPAGEWGRRPAGPILRPPPQSHTTGAAPRSGPRGPVGGRTRAASAPVGWMRQGLGHAGPGLPGILTHHPFANVDLERLVAAAASHGHRWAGPGGHHRGDLRDQSMRQRISQHARILELHLQHKRPWRRAPRRAGSPCARPGPAPMAHCAWQHPAPHYRSFPSGNEPPPNKEALAMHYARSSGHPHYASRSVNPTFSVLWVPENRLRPARALACPCMPLLLAMAPSPSRGSALLSMSQVSSSHNCERIISSYCRFRESVLGPAGGQAKELYPRLPAVTPVRFDEAHPHLTPGRPMAPPSQFEKRSASTN